MQRQRYRRIVPTPPRPPVTPYVRPQRIRQPPAYLKDYVTTSKRAMVDLPEWQRKVYWLEEQAAKGRFKGLEIALSKTILEIIKTG